MTGWALHPQLAADTHPVAELDLCSVRLMDDARFPWAILVPRRAGLVEWSDLSREDQHRLADEVDATCRALSALHAPEKLNVATLGNIVRQLHVHVVARHRADAAWPGPVWGCGGSRGYSGDGDAERAAAALAAALASIR